MNKFNEYILKLLKDHTPIIIGGDFNVIPTDDDVYEPLNFKDDACAHPKTRKLYRILINSIEFHRTPQDSIRIPQDSNVFHRIPQNPTDPVGSY